MTFSWCIEDKILAHFFKGVPFTAASGYWMYLMEDYPGQVIPTEGRYNFPFVTPADWNFASGGLISNANPITFTALADFPTPVGGWMLGADVCNGGYPPEARYFFAEAVDTPKDVYQGDVVIFDTGQLTIGQDSGALPGHFTDDAEDKLLNHVFGKEDYPAPDIWLGLLLEDPTDLGANDDCNEVPWLWGGYTRVATSFTDWAYFGWGALENAIAFEFPRAEEAWGTVKYYGLFDVETPIEQGNLLVYGALVTEFPTGSPPEPPTIVPYSVGPGSKPKFEPADLRVYWSL